MTRTQLDALLADTSLDPTACWAQATATVLTPEVPFEEHLRVYAALRERWDPERGPFPAWVPPVGSWQESAVGKLGARVGIESYDALYAWSIDDRAGFWKEVVGALGIPFRAEPNAVLDPASTSEHPHWFPDGRLNIADACFGGDPERTVIVFQREGGELERWSLATLRRLCERVANGLSGIGLEPGDAVAVDMPMTPESVAIYLGAVMAGCPVVSIADSFAPPEISTRLRIGAAKAVFTQDVILRGGKRLPLYRKVLEADAPKAIVLAAGGDPGEGLSEALRDGDLQWSAFLGNDGYLARACAAETTTNVLFSSGTTGDPKAIPWSHTTPIKCAADGALHHDIQEGDVVAWPTNLGWMMGPWLIYASLINGASMALYCGAPTGRAFGQFVQDAGVTMLGVVPSLVKAWRESDCLSGLDWSAVKAFSSTGECSNAEDMLWLMSRAGYRPVIEYCGGTEIGGGYLTGTVVQPASPGTFTTPALGLALTLRDEAGEPTQNGEVFLIPPSIGLSLELLNRDHHEVYFADTPEPGLRRHGDQLEALGGGACRALGRVDDTMNLGGIKVSSAAIEQLLNTAPGVTQTAAIAVSEKGPSKLVVYVEGDVPDVESLREEFQTRIRRDLNPLFKVSEVVPIARLPRTASNKVMRRTLRAQYLA
jgi:acetyl-CoA synthetase